MTKLEEKLSKLTPEERKKAVDFIGSQVGSMEQKKTSKKKTATKTKKK